MFSVRVFLRDDGLIEWLDVPSGYSITELLAKYGEPEQIWFYSGGLSGYGLPPSFSLVLFYPRLGVLSYNFDGKGEYYKDGNTSSIRVCEKHFSDAHPFSRFYLWNSNNPQTFEQVKAHLLFGLAEWQYRPLEDVTNLSISAFTRAFSSPNSELCLLSPIDIWPFPLP